MSIIFSGFHSITHDLFDICLTFYSWIDPVLNIDFIISSPLTDFYLTEDRVTVIFLAFLGILSLSVFVSQIITLMSLHFLIFPLATPLSANCVNLSTAFDVVFASMVSLSLA